MALPGTTISRVGKLAGYPADSGILAILETDLNFYLVLRKKKKVKLLTFSV